MMLHFRHAHIVSLRQTHLIKWALVFLHITGFFIIFSAYSFVLSNQIQMREEEKQNERIREYERLSSLPVIAKSYVIYDFKEKKILGAKNATSTLPLASLSKIVTAYVALEEGGRSKKVVIPHFPYKKSLDYGLRPGEVWDLAELVRYMILISSNDAAESIALSFGNRDHFIASMNEVAGSIDPHFIFTSPSGLDDDAADQIGGKGTVFAVAKVFALLYQKYPEIIEASTKGRISVTVQNKVKNGIPNTNTEVEMYPGVLGSKTGFTDAAGGNLVMLFDKGFGDPVVIVLFGSTREGRFSDMQVLYKGMKSTQSISPISTYKMAPKEL